MLRATLTLFAALMLTTSTPGAQPMARSVDVDGAAVHYAVAGNGGDTILFVHGWSCDGSAWDAQVADLATRYRIVTIDQSGPATAFAKVECALPPRFFVDYLTLLKTKDGWRIVAKAFKTETR